MFHIIMSIRQLLRTPVKTLLFVLLLAAVTIMLVFGSVLYLQALAHIEAVEAQYTTLGMVTQRPSYTRTVSWEYGCGAQGSAIYDVYDEIIPIDVLDFEGADYVLPPEERMFYVAKVGVDNMNIAGSVVVKNDGIIFMAQEPGPNDPILAELEAFTDSVDGAPAKMRILQKLYGYTMTFSEEADTLTLCQHNCSDPIPIQAGEKYMAVLVKQGYCPEHHIVEYIPMPSIYSSQYNLDGTPVDGEAPGFHLFRQDGDGSWITSHTPGGSPVDFQQMGNMIQHEDESYSFGKWLELLNHLRNKDTYYPAIATNNMDLLPSWQAKRLKIKDGRAITSEEFEEGAHVCLIPESWNRKHEGRDFNQFSPGPTSDLRFPIAMALKNYPASKFDTLGNDTFFDPFSFFSSEGKTYAIYAGGAYNIVGTFTMDLEGLDTGDIDLAANCMIIPAKSLGDRQQENIAYFGPMTGTYVSFQIPNGTISEFNRKLHEAVPEADLLEITYSDNGYEQVMPPLERTRAAALLLCAVGAASAVAVIVLLLYFFITRERRRTAIERGLGMTKHQCRVSLMAGILALALAGTILGSRLGTMMVGSVDLDSDAGQESSYSVYHTKYSDWTNKWNQVIEVQDVRPVPVDALAAGIPLVLLVLITVLSLMMVEFNLRVEPITILGGKNA